MTLRFLTGLGVALVACACSEAQEASPENLAFRWIAHTNAALLSVHGTAANDAWLCGADDGRGPLVLRWDGARWDRKDTGVSGDLWWVHATAWEDVWFAGSHALALRYGRAGFEVLATPGGAEHTLFGVWAADVDDVYFAGSVAGRNGFLWRYRGGNLEELPLPDDMPVDADGKRAGLLKVWGTSASDVWAVGSDGVVLRGNGDAGFELVRSGGSDMLFTVHAMNGHVAIAGGLSSGRLLESDGDEILDVTPPGAPLLQGVSVGANGDVWAAGWAGSLYADEGRGFEAVDSGLDFLAGQSLHAVWLDPSGGVWGAGGDVLTPALSQGLALQRGANVAVYAE
jgi:hypothetical protein